MKIKLLKSIIIMLPFVLFFQLVYGQYVNVNPPINAQTSCALQNNGLSNSETAVDMLGIGCTTYKAVVSNSQLNIEYFNCVNSPAFSSTAISLQREITNPDVSLMID